MATKKKVREAAVLLGRKGGKSKSTAKVAAARRNGVLGGRAKGGRSKRIVQDGVVCLDEGGGTYVPQEKKP